jgi:PAS domain S-box-containing protein
MLRADRLDARPPAMRGGPDTFLVVGALRAMKLAVYDAIEQHQLQVSARQMRLIGEYFAAATEAAWRARMHLLGAMLDAIPDSVLLADADPAAHYLYLNRAAASNVATMTGLPPEALLGRSVDEVPLPRSFTEQITETWIRTRRGETVTQEIRVPTPKGERWYERLASPLFDAEGQVEAIAIASRDIDARKRAEEKLAQELAFRERMVGILGHDLRNPVSAVLGLTGLLQLEDGLSEKARERIQLIAQSARRMNEMIATLLDFTQLRFRGDLHLERAAIDLAVVVRAVVDELRAAHPNREISLSCPGDVPGEWDAGRMSQLLSNLVSNALTHGDPQSTVQVELRGDAATVALSVQNRGPTIPADCIGQLFEPFYQASQDALLRSRGLGLGLYIVRAIADAHGGSVDVGSADGLTSFTVRFTR